MKLEDLIGMLKDGDKELIDSLKGVIETKDQLLLVPLQPKILETFLIYYKENPKSRATATLTEILIYTTQFCEMNFYPRDISFLANTILQNTQNKNLDPKLRPSLTPELRKLLSEISQMTNADSIERSYLQAIYKSLTYYDIPDIQLLRWVTQHIEETSIVDENNKSVHIRRFLEHGEKFPEKKKPLKPIDIKETISSCRRAFTKLSEGLDDQPEEIKSFIETFKEAAKRFKDIEKYYSYPKVIENGLYFQELNQVMDKFISQHSSSLNKDINSYAQRNSESLKILCKIYGYTNEGVITTMSAYKSLLNAMNVLSVDIKSSSNPDFIHRMSAIYGSILKINSMVVHPLLQESNITEIRSSLEILQQDLESRVVSNEFQIAHWLLGSPKILQASLIMKLKEISISMKETADVIENNKPNYDGNDLKQAADQWINFLNRNENVVESMSEDIQPDKQTNATELIQIRSTFDSLLTRIDGLGIDENAETITRNIELAVSIIQKETYYHKSKFEEKNKHQHVSFSKPGEETEPQKSEKVSDISYTRFYPQDIHHTIYESWGFDEFKDSVKITKSVPIDMKTFSRTITAKLTRHRTTRIEARNNFESYILEPSDSQKREKVQKPEDLNKQKEDIKKIEDDLKNVKDLPLGEQYLFVERSIPLLNSMYLEEDPELASQYDQIIPKVNNVIKGLSNDSSFILPRQAVAMLNTRLQAIVTILQYCRQLQEEEEKSPIIDNWIDYFSDILRCNNIVCDADDEVAIVGSKSFYVTSRSGIASFSQQAETLDQKYKMRSFLHLTKIILFLTEKIIKFNQQILFTELCSVEDAQAQLKDLEKEFKKSKSKDLYEQQKSSIASQLSSPELNYSIADNVSQQLKSIHVGLEPKIKSDEDDEYELFIMTIGVRLSILNLHVSDADPDAKLQELSETTIADFNSLISFIQKESDETPRGVLAQKWVLYLKECLHDVEGIHSSADIVVKSPTRYNAMMNNLIDISTSLSILENKKFPLSTTPYGKLSLHLDKLIDYTRAHRSTDSKKKKSSALPSLLQEQLLSTKMDTLATTNYDELFAPFSDGFMPPISLQSQINDNLAKSISQKNEITFSIAKVMSLLFAAQVDSLSRNYNIGTKSTRVTYELLDKYCKSIIECTEEAKNALETKDIKNLEEKVKLHVNSIQQIQNHYDDKMVYSDFGRQRIIIFSRYCMIVSQLTKLNIYHLATQDDNFDFDEPQVQFRSIRQIFSSMERFYNQNVIDESFSKIEQVSHTMIDEYSSLVTSISILDVESKFCQDLSELISLLMAENDARLWKARDVQLNDAEMEIIKPSKEGEKIAASDLKKSVEIVHDTLTTFKSTLQNREVEVPAIIQITQSLNEVTGVFYKAAMQVEGDDEFYCLVSKFRQQTVVVVSYIHQQLTVGTHNLYSDEINSMLKDLTNLSLRIIRQLDLMEQLEDPELVLGDLFSNLIKHLLLARDDIINITSKIGQETAIEFGKYIGSSYEIVANALLLIKNSNARILTKLLTEKIKLLRHIVFATQSILSSATEIENFEQDYINQLIESPEFLFKANYKPLLHSFNIFKKSIPKIIPSANTLLRYMTSLIVKMNIIIEPHFEERPLLSL